MTRGVLMGEGMLRAVCRRKSRNVRKHMPSVWRTPIALPVAARGNLDMDQYYQYQIAPNLGWGIISTRTIYKQTPTHTHFCLYLACEPKGSRVFVHLQISQAVGGWFGGQVSYNATNASAFQFHTCHESFVSYPQHWRVCLWSSRVSPGVRTSPGSAAATGAWNTPGLWEVKAFNNPMQINDQQFTLQYIYI